MSNRGPLHSPAICLFYNSELIEIRVGWWFCLGFFCCWLIPFFFVQTILCSVPGLWVLRENEETCEKTPRNSGGLVLKEHTPLWLVCGSVRRALGHRTLPDSTDQRGSDAWEPNGSMQPSCMACCRPSRFITCKVINWGHPFMQTHSKLQAKKLKPS